MNEREEIIDRFTSVIGSMANEIAAFEEKVFWDAISFFNVNIEDIRDRCERCYHQGQLYKRTLRIDGKDAVTIVDAFEPGSETAVNVKVTLKAIRHYLGESE